MALEITFFADAIQIILDQYTTAQNTGIPLPMGPGGTIDVLQKNATISKVLTASFNESSNQVLVQYGKTTASVTNLSGMTTMGTGTEDYARTMISGDTEILAGYRGLKGTFIDQLILEGYDDPRLDRMGDGDGKVELWEVFKFGPRL